jgi:hypothetical protein
MYAYADAERRIDVHLYRAIYKPIYGGAAAKGERRRRSAANRDRPQTGPKKHTEIII